MLSLHRIGRHRGGQDGARDKGMKEQKIEKREQRKSMAHQCTCAFQAPDEDRETPASIELSTQH